MGQTDGESWIGAVGNGGPRIWLVPALDRLVVTTMGLYDAPEQGRVPLEILKAALSAVRQEA